MWADRAALLAAIALAACQAAPPPKPAPDPAAEAARKQAVAGCFKGVADACVSAGYPAQGPEWHQCLQARLRPACGYLYGLDTAALPAAPPSTTTTCIPNALGGFTCSER